MAGTREESKTQIYNKTLLSPIKTRNIKNGIKLKDTDPVNAKIVFYDKGGKILSNLSSGQAFWYNDKPRAKRNSRTENDLIIKKSGQVEGIVLVIKEVGKPFLFAFNHNSYIPGTGDFRFDESMKIKTNLVYAYVHISDGNFEKTYWVKIINQPRKEHPLFELVESPLSKKSKQE